MRIFRLLLMALFLLPRAFGQAAAVDLKVLDAACHKLHRAPGDASDKQDHCELGDTVTVRFSNLDEWMAANTELHDPRHLVIAFNGHALQGTAPNVLIAGSNELSFAINAPEGTDEEANANKQAWRAILRKHRSPTQLTLSVGLKNGQTFYGSYPLNFKLYPWYARIVFVMIALLFLSVGYLSAHSGMIRVPGPKPDGGQARPFSLGRSQMAWWFLLVIASYLYIWLITDNRDSLTSGVLILIGISAATGLGSQVAGGKKDDAAIVPVAASQGFFQDLLEDENGVSFDRLQMVSWTFVLGLVFVVEVWTDLHMPDFSQTLLGLMGISSGTYVGFKLPGKNT